MADFSNQRSQRREHSPLVRGRSIPKTLGHYGPFVQSEGSSYRSKLDVIWMHFRLKECIGHIELTPNLPSPAIGKDFLYGRKRVCIGKGEFVQKTIVVNPSRVSRRVSFRNEESG